MENLSLPTAAPMRAPDGLRVAALVPVYNEAETIGPLLERLKPQVEAILVVDDGSTDGSLQAAVATGVPVHSRPNGGKGRALRTGMARLLREDYTHIITLDADLQHQPEDLPRFRRAAVRTGATLVIGSRLHMKEGYPVARRQANVVGDWILSLAMGTEVNDAQSGYRLYSVPLLRRLELHENGFAIETELLIRIIRAGGRLAYVPIPPIYAGMESYYRPILDTYKIFIASANALENLYDGHGRL